MSDIEGLCLQSAPSITSDAEQDLTPAVRSLSSIDLVQHKDHRHKSTMSGDPHFTGFRPGFQKPPHHQIQQREDDNGEERDAKPPRAPPMKRQQSTHQWSLDVSDTPSGGTGSPRKEINDVPVFSLNARDRLNGSELDSTSSVQKSASEQDVRGDEQVLPDDSTESPRKAKERRRKKKSRRVKDPESLPLQEVDSTNEQVAAEPKNRKRNQRREQPPAVTSSVQSTGTYTIDTGVENPAYISKEQKNSPQKSAQFTDPPSLAEDQAGDDNHVDRFTPQGQSSDSLMSQQNRSLHAATLQNSAMSSETRRNINQSYTAMYVYNNIEQRECSVYARDSKSSKNICQCGREVQWHKDRGITVDVSTDHHKWHPKTHTRTMPCDSFGEILFRGFGSQSSNSPYMRVDHVSDMDKVWSVLTDCWQLPTPKLLISVTGGAKRFYLRPRLKTILKQGLVNAAVSTGAWLITGGTKTGVMEFVGEAVQDHIQASGRPEGNECVALGIASWGSVNNNLALDGEGEHGLFPASYGMEDVSFVAKGSAPLDHNHTHFLLVDNGTEAKFGGEIEFRSKFESYISQKVETGVAESQSVNVPSVLIVVEGGINTLKTVRESVKRNIPVVVIDGSGRAADFMAYAFHLTKNIHDEDGTVYPMDYEDHMNRKARVMFEWKKSMQEYDIQKNILEALNYLQDCLAERKLINIFHLDKADSVKDIDRAILYALLKANKSNANSQLALALAWNRCDIARQEIFTPENRHQWQQTHLYNAMFTALVQNRADFVQLFLDNGVDLKRFLTTRTLWNLYCNCITDQTTVEASLLRYLISYLKQTWAAFLLCRGTPDFENLPDLLPFINRVITHILQDQSFRFYTYAQHVVKDETPTMTWKGDEVTIQPMSVRMDSRKTLPEQGCISRRKSGKHKIVDPVDFENPERELFIWSVLFNRRELTHLFWRSGRDHLGGALFASALLYRLSELADNEEEAELSRDMALHSDECERWAVSVLSECYSRDKKLTHRLLVRELQHWGGVTLFKMAETYELMEFAEHSACQTKLSSIWKGRMALYTSEMKIAFCSILPILVPFIKFTVDPKANDEEDEDLLQDLEGTADGKLASPGRSPQYRNRVGPNSLPDADGDGLGFVRSKTRRRAHTLATKLKKVNLFDFTTDNINIFSAIYFFYQAPVTKFFTNIMSYVVFCGLFSYMVLVKLSPTNEENSPSAEEYVIWGWCATMIIEEIRQVFIRDQHSMKYKFRSWFSNIWNRFDAAMYLLFILSIILRYQLNGEDFVGARVTYSITLAMFLLRFMQYFYAEKNMGPKVIMIRRMLTDLMFFFLILLVFVVSFGVAYHANMFPESPPSWSILANVLYFPYFQMYGELFIENLKGDEVDDCTRNETIWREDPFKRCPTENAVVPMLLAVYMILTNILLVNLLIAMFSYTFQTVQDNSTQVWRYYRLSLVFEYFDRPSLVPPIIIINHIFRLMRYVVFRCTNTCQRPNSFLWYLTPGEQNQLTMFEKSAMENHLSVSRQQSKLTLDSRVKNTAKRLDSVMEELQRIKDSIQQQEQTRTSLSEQPDSGSTQSSNQNNLQREKELMDRAPAAPVASTKRSDTQTLYEAQEMENLRKTVEDVVSESAVMSKRISQLTHLIETSVAEQHAFMRSQQHRISALEVEDLEGKRDDDTSEV